MTADLLMIVLSRGRPQNIADLWTAWQATTANTELLIAVDDDDPTLPGYKQVCSGWGSELVVGPRLRMCPTLNKVAVERRGVAYRVGDPTLLNRFYECRVSLEEGVQRALVR